MGFCYTKDLPFQPLRSSAISLKGKTWTPGDIIDISFYGGTVDQRNFVIKEASEWTKHANLTFNWGVPIGKSDVRVSFVKGGSYSYIGTDSMFIDRDEETMNFGWLDKGTVLHEFGHMLGLGHSHSSPNSKIIWDRDAVIKDLSGAPNFWSIKQIEHNVFRKYHLSQVLATEFDPESVMLYHFPAHWTKNNVATKHNNDLSRLDIEHIKRLYPKAA